MKHKAKIKYSSKGKTPDGNPFMRVKQARGYYEYAERGGQDSIAFILFDNKSKKFCLINESKPAMDERNGEETRMTTAFGGSIDSTHPEQQICQTEVLEETGFEVSLDRVHYVGETLVSSQMSQMCVGYLVDVTGLTKTHEAEYEKEVSKTQSQKDAEEFSGNSVHWFTYSEIMENSDWKSIFISTQAIYQEKNVIGDHKWVQKDYYWSGAPVSACLSFPMVGRDISLCPGIGYNPTRQ